MPGDVDDAVRHPDVVDLIRRGANGEGASGDSREPFGTLVVPCVLQSLRLDEDMQVFVQHGLQFSVEAVIENREPVGLVAAGPEQRHDLRTVEHRAQRPRDLERGRQRAPPVTVPMDRSMR